ncbi:hypothetical protein A1O1_03522 [Capronia coronata CBS 617.96]|uniref:Uncharacterized protein n=1 Tax=Capronia coronata CBS 617.96 TaxID=1182541 RepID=W9YMH3_9EURO|nr:uncharacterized protein A1O1_03522 [Capronia coronata CBS 617.96]EXJ90421.1 hypothetical protein A1O1_03522 [Capronia coronata CBS 617.96]
MPTVHTGQGTRLLLEITEKGITDLTSLGDDMKKTAAVTERIYVEVRMQWLAYLMVMRGQLGSTFDEDSAQTHASQVFRPYEMQAHNYKQCCDLAQRVIDKFVQLQKLAGTVLAAQEEMGEQLTQTEEGVKKLTIGIKCIDTVWLDITTSFARLKLAVDELEKTEVIGALMGEGEPGPSVQELEEDDGITQAENENDSGSGAVSNSEEEEDDDAAIAEQEEEEEVSVSDTTTATTATTVPEQGLLQTNSALLGGGEGVLFPVRCLQTVYEEDEEAA